MKMFIDCNRLEKRFDITPNLSIEWYFSIYTRLIWLQLSWLYWRISFNIVLKEIK